MFGEDLSTTDAQSPMAVNSLNQSENGQSAKVEVRDERILI